MNEITINVDENEMISLIRNLLCLTDKSSYHRHTIESHLAIKFTGDYLTIQKAVYEWLSVPQRKRTFGGE
ncbi:MAG: hypothetical protein BWY21_01480 [Parcubacteria group bacterium ADurb.Bin216]|jgi:uncharacterized protein (DUF2237 family)|nr:MAG: hypothetical protein BWY21_01480 [Parcubacteria group bacterium ADurb.Bin216]